MRVVRILLALLLASPIAAYADTLQYLFSPIYPAYPTHTFSFQISSNPSPDDLLVNTGQGFFGVKNVPVVADGVTGTYLIVFNLNQVFSPPTTGGDLIIAGGFYNSGQPTFTYLNTTPLYSGSAYAPTLLTGSFVLQEYGAPYGGSQGLLTVTRVDAAITPEPSSIALLATGMLSMGGLLRRRYARE